MADTPNHEYNVPDQGDQDWHQPLNENFEAFEVDIELRDQESNIGNYTPTDGAKFLATDTGVVYLGDGNSWNAAFVAAEYDDSAGTATISGTLVTSELEVGTISGSVTGGQSLTDIAGNNLSIDGNGQLNASGGGGGGGGISNLSGGDGIEPGSIGDGDTISVAWGDANDLDGSGAVDTISGSVTGGTTLSDLTGTNLSIDSNGRLNATTSGGGISGLSGGDGIEPGSIGDGDTISVAWGDANDLDGDGNLTGGNWTVNGDLLAPSDSSIAGIDVDEVNAGALRAGSGPLTLTVNGARVLSMTAEDSGDAGNVVAGNSVNVVPSGVRGATISGGGNDVGPNEVTGDYGSIGGGFGNVVEAPGAIIAGGNGNAASGLNSTVGGGLSNEAFGTNATIAGGDENLVVGDNSTVAGGYSNVAEGNTATIGGGSSNEANANYGTIAGGGPSDTNDPENTSNEVNDEYGTVGGGGNNQAGTDLGSSDQAKFATVAGGENNAATGSHGTVGGGQGNEASGSNATVPGGSNNQAGGTNSFAAGNQAKATNDGTFVWADSQSGNVSSTADNAFLVWANGGTGIGTTSPVTTFHVRDEVAESGGDNLGRHVAAIENTSQSSNPVPDMLGLEFTNISNPTQFNSYISFMDDSGTIGNIQGDGNGGVEFNGSVASSSADFAECFPKADPEAAFADGTVVGLVDGEVVDLATTADPDAVMVVSTAPLVTGNRPEDVDDRDDYVELTLFGQVPVQVSGPVSAGDVLVASPDDDGTAVAREGSLAEAHPVVGRALADGEAGEAVRTLVGGPGIDAAPTADATHLEGEEATGQADHIHELETQLAEKDERIRELEADRDELRAENERLRDRLAAVEDHLGLDSAAGPAPADD